MPTCAPDYESLQAVRRQRKCHRTAVACNRLAAYGFSTPAMYTRLSIYDSFFASRPHHHSHLRPDGGHRAACLRLRAASRFQSPPLATRASPRLSGTARRRFSHHWRRGYRWPGGSPRLSRPGEPQRILRRSVEPAIQPLRICLVRRISRRINRANNNGAPPENSSFTFSRYLLPRRLCRLRYRTYRLLSFRRRRLRQAHHLAMALGNGIPAWRG